MLSPILQPMSRKPATGGRLEPTGKDHRDAAGNAWVVIRGVHPNFVAAVEAARAGAAAQVQRVAATNTQST